MELVIYSEGAISYSEVWQMSYAERSNFIKILNSYNEIKSGKKPTEYL